MLYFELSTNHRLVFFVADHSEPVSSLLVPSPWLPTSQYAWGMRTCSHEVIFLLLPWNPSFDIFVPHHPKQNHPRVSLSFFLSITQICFKLSAICFYTYCYHQYAGFMDKLFNSESFIHLSNK